MRAIQNYIPKPHHTETMRIFVQAAPEVAWEKIQHYDLSSISWIRLLFNIRSLATLFHKNINAHKDKRIVLDQVIENNNGFKLLYRSAKEVVVGSVGKFWHTEIEFADIKPEEFTQFKQPGWGKIAWSLRVEPYLYGSTISFELRTTATDEDSWKMLNLYYHLIGSFSKLIRHTLMSHLEKELLALSLPDDRTRYLPGDDIVQETRFSSTDHIDIEAPVSIVWNYLMQLGCDRAGWYSIDVFDHGGIRSTDHLVNEWMDRKVGDKIPATPQKDSFFEVYQLRKEEYFVLGGEVKTDEGFFNSSWSFILEPLGEDATHLVVRAKMAMTPEWKEWFMGTLFYPLVHTLMETVQLKTLRVYAERDAQMREAKPSAIITDVRF